MRKITTNIILIFLLAAYLGTFSQGIRQVLAAETKPTVYICGDSTVQTYSASYAPQAGWGQYISKYFTGDVIFVNKAIGGRSSKSFIVEGRLDQIINVLKPNDYLLIQFGHNDATISKPERYTEPNTTYKEYLRQYIDKARSKQAIPVLITPVARLNYSNGIFKNDFPAYCTAMKEVAQEKNVACIDLMSKSLNYYSTIGYDMVYPYYMVSVNKTDYTHFTDKGATQMARLVAEGIKELNLSISKYVISSTPTATPTSTPVPTPTPTPVPGGSLYQAENAVYGGTNTILETTNTGYYGTGYINFPMNGGYLEFQNIDGGNGGTVTLLFRYALGSDTSRTGRIQVNGEAWQDITFDPTGAWTTWNVKEVTESLHNGTSNTIRLESTGQDLANIDQADIRMSTIKKGDVNHDGSVDALDFALIKKHILGSELLTGDGLKAADVDGSNSVDALDYSQLKKYLLGLISGF